MTSPGGLKADGRWNCRYDRVGGGALGDVHKFLAETIGRISCQRPAWLVHMAGDSLSGCETIKVGPGSPNWSTFGSLRHHLNVTKKLRLTSNRALHTTTRSLLSPTGAYIIEDYQSGRTRT